MPSRTVKLIYLRLDIISNDKARPSRIKHDKRTSSGDCLGNFAACEAYDMLATGSRQEATFQAEIWIFQKVN